VEKVIVKNSPIHGRGVYATRNIPKEGVVLKIDDSQVVADDSRLTKKQLEFDCDYLANRKTILMQPPEKYINHSCSPNTYVKTIKGIRQVIAWRNILKGEEITYDYSINGDNEGTFICKCGSYRCRKIYYGSFFKLPTHLQKEYLPYLEDWFIKQHQQKISRLRKKLRGNG